MKDLTVATVRDSAAMKQVFVCFLYWLCVAKEAMLYRLLI